MMPSRPAPHTATEEYPTSSGRAAPAGSPILICAFPKDVALALPASGEVVGRAWLAEVGVRDLKVSGEHLRFSRREGRVHIEDTGSRNGTWLDGDRIAPGHPVALDDGAILRLGRTLLVYRAAFVGAATPADPVGFLAGPWGLGALRARLDDLSRSRPPNVLIEGATGTGKELVAAAVIKALRRPASRSASINVAAIAAGVFEAQLFGWEKGAHSGAAQAGKGIFRENDGGSVFLDEIGELPMDLQPKLLRLIENGDIQPVGGGPVKVNVAVIAATNRSLAEAVERGAFRRDLHARFTERIELPPLADRPEDVYAILRSLVTRRGAALDEERADVDAVEHLLLHDWPANVRDLVRVAAALGSAGQLTLDLVEGVTGPRRVAAELTPEAARRMLQECGGNEHAVERRFGVKRGKLRRVLGKAGRGGAG